MGGYGSHSSQARTDTWRPAEAVRPILQLSTSPGTEQLESLAYGDEDTNDGAGSGTRSRFREQRDGTRNYGQLQSNERYEHQGGGRITRQEDQYIARDAVVGRDHERKTEAQSWPETVVSAPQLAAPSHSHHVPYGQMTPQREQGYNRPAGYGGAGLPTDAGRYGYGFDRS